MAQMDHAGHRHIPQILAPHTAQKVPQWHKAHRRRIA